LPLLVAGFKPKKARRLTLLALEMVGLSDQAGKRPAEMSGG
jgi:ABC-type ATPase involved in cell division